MTRYEWGETKRASNLEKHGPDFNDAHLVYKNEEKLTLQSPRGVEPRLQDMALVEMAGEGCRWSTCFAVRLYESSRSAA